MTHSYRAVAVGVTGAVGGALLRELLASISCTGVVAIARRPVDTYDAVAARGKLLVEVSDFGDLERVTSQSARGCDVAFCTVGIGQPRKVSAEEFHRVDVEYAGAFARGAAAAGVRHISLLSSVGANAASRNWYLRTKGLAERAVADAGITRTSLFRPSLLATEKSRYGVLDSFNQTVFPLLSPLLPSRYHEIRVEDLARAMRLNAETDGPSGVEVLHYRDFAALLRSV